MKLLSILISAIFISGFTMKSKSENLINIEGKIATFGSTPHTYIGIKVGNKIYKISNPEDFKLNYLQNKKVKLKALLIKKEVGPGFPAEVKVVDLE